MNPASDSRTPTFVSERFAKAMSNKVRVQFVVEASQRPMSATSFMARYPQYSHSQIWWHCIKLEDLGCLERVEVLSGGERRGGNEVFFRANVRALFDQTSWATIPEGIKETFTGVTAASLFERVAEAIKTGTMEIRPDRHFTWLDAYFDQQAWDETIGDLEAIHARLPDRLAEAGVRLAESGEESIRATVALACFESPKGTSKV